MRITPTAGLAALCTLALAACATKSPPMSSWVHKGLLVHVSGELAPDVAPYAGAPAGPSGVGIGAPPGPGGDVRSEAGTTLAPLGHRLPACEPVEVRSVSAERLLVKWLQEGGQRSTLTGDWRSRVHQTKEECLARVRERAKAP